MSKNTGGPAFPGLHPSKECTYKDSGMTLRDYFAAKAMQAIVVDTMKATSGDAERAARNAYVIADWMLQAREE